MQAHPEDQSGSGTSRGAWPRLVPACTAGGEGLKSSRAAAGLAWVARLRRLGLVGFAFFFFKGLLWLALPFIARHLMA